MFKNFIKKKKKCSQNSNEPGAPDRSKCKTSVKGQNFNPTPIVFPAEQKFTIKSYKAS